MGCHMSCKRSSRIKKMKIIHLNGYIEELEYPVPVTVSEVVGKPAQNFLFTRAQLLSGASTPLKPDVVLEPGRVYFLLPFSLFQSNVSPLDLAPIARKLASMSGSRKSTMTGPNPMTTSRPKASLRGLVSMERGEDGSSNSSSWKPILETILERSFNRRTESLDHLVLDDHHAL